MRDEYSIERFCDSFAAALLVPETNLRSVLIEEDLQLSDGINYIKRLADKFNVSREVIAHRIGDLNILDNSQEFIIIMDYNHERNKIDVSYSAPKEFLNWKFTGIKDMPDKIDKNEKEIISQCHFKNHRSIECHGRFFLIHKKELMIGLFTMTD